jgi:hypothetical protein
MRLRMFAFIWFAAMAAAPLTLSADGGCCDTAAMACCDKADASAMSCCDKGAGSHTGAAGCCDKTEAGNNGSVAGCCDKAPATVGHAHEVKGCCDKAASGGRDAGCCDKAPAIAEAPAMDCCKDTEAVMPCCGKPAATASAVDVLLAMDRHTVPPGEQMAPTVQTAAVFFHRPVWVGSVVVMGKYIIEHDTARQARGEPCTHLYAAADYSPNAKRRLPTATFHCTHLDAGPADRDVVVLQTLADGTQRLLQFQFAGDTAAHGYPTR